MFTKSRSLFVGRRNPICSICQNVRYLSVEQQVKLAIFSQNGTLNCIDTLYAQWCEDTAKTLSRFLGTDVPADFYKVVSYHPIKKKVLQGGISEQPHHLLKQSLIDLLEKKYHRDRLNVRSLVKDIWRQDIGENETVERVKPIGRILEAFERLKGNGLKIAVCTTETRPNTVKILESLGVSRMIDVMMCGDDDAVFPKPHPSNVYAICAATGVKPVNTAVIGDTRTDMMLGHKSKIGSTIGVLCGVGSLQVLEPFADKIVENIEQIPDIFLEENAQEPQFAMTRNHSFSESIQPYFFNPAL